MHTTVKLPVCLSLTLNLLLATVLFKSGVLRRPIVCVTAKINKTFRNNIWWSQYIVIDAVQWRRNLLVKRYKWEKIKLHVRKIWCKMNKFIFIKYLILVFQYLQISCNYQSLTWSLPTNTIIDLDLYSPSLSVSVSWSWPIYSKRELSLFSLSYLE